MKVPLAFLFLSAIGVVEAFYHAWLEHAFTTNYSAVSYAPVASFFGVPYWVFGVVWFPLVLVVGLWATRSGRNPLKTWLLVLLSVGNMFTVYLWYLDLVEIRAFTAVYVGLYVTNYALTGLVVAENWSRSEMKDFTAGTVIGMAIGVFFGPFGAAALGVLGGLFGALSGYTSTQ
jgi:uncharacterized membrane protein